MRGGGQRICILRGLACEGELVGNGKISARKNSKSV